MKTETINKICDMLGSEDEQMRQLGIQMGAYAIDSYVDYRQLKEAFKNKYVYTSSPWTGSRIKRRLAGMYDVNMLIYKRLKDKYEIE